MLAQHPSEGIFIISYWAGMKEEKWCMNAIQVDD